MAASKMTRPTTSGQLTFALLLLAALCIHSIGCEQTMTSQNFKESASLSGSQGDEQQLAANTLAALNRADGLGAQSSSLRANSRLLAVPLSLARFMFPRSRQAGGGQAGEHFMSAGGVDGGGGGGGFAGVSNSKRSAQSSVAGGGLDTLIGASGLGKRSVPVEYINLEPILGRQALERGAPRVHSVRWEPVDVAEGPLAANDY